MLFLPGRRDSLGAYRRRDFAGMAARAGVSAEYLEVDAHLGYYQAETVSRRLHEDVVLPAHQRGVHKIWIAGISMGGLGGLLYAKDHPGQVRGVIALAPYLGDTEPANVATAGGLAQWKPGAPRQIADYERQLWAWLKSYLGGAGADASAGTGNHRAAAPIPTELYIGYGLSDELAPADKLLADVLHPDRVFTVPGSHDWRTWTALWRAVLEGGALQRDCGRDGNEGKDGPPP